MMACQEVHHFLGIDENGFQGRLERRSREEIPILFFSRASWDFIILWTSLLLQRVSPF